MEKVYTTQKEHWTLPGDVPFSQGIRVGTLVFVGGQSDFDEHGNVRHPGDIEAQSHGTMQNLQRVLESLGATLDDVVQTNTFYVGALTHEDWQRCAAVRFSYFKRPGPTSTAINVGHFLNIPEVLVEVNAIAVVGE